MLNIHSSSLRYGIWGSRFWGSCHFFQLSFTDAFPTICTFYKYLLVLVVRDSPFLLSSLIDIDFQLLALPFYFSSYLEIYPSFNSLTKTLLYSRFYFLRSPPLNQCGTLKKNNCDALTTNEIYKKKCDIGKKREKKNRP